MPILIIVLFFMYFLQREKGWLVSVLGTLAGYLVSALLVFDIAPYYSYGNYIVLWKISKYLINENNIKIVIIALCIFLGTLAGFLMGKKGAALAEKIGESVENSRIWYQTCRWGIRSLLVLSGLFFLYKGVITAEYTRYFEYLQISTFTYMTGLILIPFLYVYLFLKPEKRTAGQDDGISIAVFLLYYCLFFFYEAGCSVLLLLCQICYDLFECCIYSGRETARRSKRYGKRKILCSGGAVSGLSDISTL